MDHEEIRTWIVAEHDSGHLVTLKEIATRWACSMRTAFTIRNGLVTAGILPQGEIRSGGRGGRPPNAPPSEPQKLSLSVDEQRSLLSQLIVGSPSHAIKVAAQNALTRLDAQAGTSMSFGPGAPLTEPARVERLTLLLKACGLVTVRSAMKRAFPKSYARYEVALVEEPTVETTTETSAQ